MQENQNNLLLEVADYYSNKFEQHGESPLGVDWNSKKSQELRFEQLCKIISQKTSFSLNDLGCGYGALYDYIVNRYSNFDYRGIDLSQGMIQSAEKRFQDVVNTKFIVSNRPDSIADYGLASGIFNVRLKCSNSEWRDYIEDTIDILDRTSRFGFSFNCLTSYSDKEKMHDYLYYADPCSLFDLCKRRYSRNIALLHDYDLYEFSILVKKTS